MDDWERYDEELLPDKEAFHSGLKMKDITDVDYRHAKRVYIEFNNKNLGDYHDLYVQSDKLLIADVFENFRNMCYNIHDLDPAYFWSASGLAWQACLRMKEVKLELLVDNNMLLMIEKGIRAGICHGIHRYAKANNKYLKDYDKNIESSYLMYFINLIKSS